MQLVTCEQLKAAPWQKTLKEVKKEVVDYYWASFNKIISELNSDDEHIPALRLLEAICSPRLQSHREQREPFTPLMTGSDGRTFLPEDLSLEQGEELFKFLNDVDDQELKSRIADTLWISKKCKQKQIAAKIAIGAYLISGEQLIRSDSHGGEKRLSRAVDIAKELGRGAVEAFEQAIGLIERLALEKEGISGAKQRELLEVLLHNRQGSPERCGAHCEEVARAEAEVGYFRGERRGWNLAAQWHKRAGNEQAEREAKIHEAETYVFEADHASSAIVEAHALQQGIEAFRRIGGEEERIKKLHHRLIESENRIEQEMHPVSVPPIDITEIVQQIEEEIKGKELVEALIKFARITDPPAPEELKEEVERLAEESVLSSLVGRTHVNAQGKTVAKTPAAIFGDETNAAVALLHKMHDNFQLHASLNVEGVIIPALKQVLREHHITLRLMCELVQNNQFVPEGREMIFARGLKAGFDGDFLTSTHFLAPQIENSLRSLIAQQGGITSGLTTEGIQREHGLEIVLADEHIKNIFDDRHLFALETLLIKQTGFNLRHDMAHGLVGHESFYSAPAVYFWWLVFRICMIPVIMNYHQAKSTKDQSNKVVEKDT